MFRQLAAAALAAFALPMACAPAQGGDVKDVSSALPQKLAGEIALPKGGFSGDIMISKGPLKLSAKRLGDFVLKGRIVVEGASDVILENIVVDGCRPTVAKGSMGIEEAPETLLEIRKSEKVQVKGCVLFAFDKELQDLGGSQPSVSESKLYWNAKGMKIDSSSSVVIAGTRVATNDSRLQAFNSKGLKIIDCDFCEASAVGAQRGLFLRLRNVYDGSPERIHNVSGLELKGDVFRGLGRNHAVLELRGLSDWKSDENLFWGTISPPEDCRAGSRWDVVVARSLQDWRELSGRDAKSRTARIDYVADKELGFKRDPEGALTGKPGISIPLPSEIPGGRVSVGVFGEDGSLVRSLVAEYEPHGAKSLDLHWDGTDNLNRRVEPGSYFVRAIAPNLKTEQSWIANSFGTYEGHVQQNILGIAAAPNGCVYGICVWDEAGAEIKKYAPDGKSEFLKKNPELHGWGRGGSSEIAADDKFIYAATTQSGDDGANALKNKNGLAQFPQKGKKWFCLRRYDFDGERIPFPEGFGYDCSMLILGEEDCIGGIAAAGGKVYVSNFKLGKISEFDRETLKELRSWTVGNPGRIALDGNGGLWISPRAAMDFQDRFNDWKAKRDSDASKPDASSLLQCLDLKSGSIRSLPVKGLATPSAIAFDANGRMLVADDGPDMQVKAFELSDAGLRQFDSIGREKGIYADKPGETAPDKFNGISGLAVDASGCVYVASTRSGGELRKLSSSKKLLWHLLGLAFVDGACPDPESPEDVFMKEERFKLDYSKRPLAWSYAAYTRDLRRPEALNRDLASCLVRRIDGRRFMFCTRMFPQAGLSVFKFEGELAVPCAFVGMEKKDAKIWRDANGDGVMDASECQYAKDSNVPEPFLVSGDHGSWSWFVDEKGDVWKTYNTAGIMRLPCQGLDGKGNPVYDFATAEYFPMPKPFVESHSVEYVPSSDAIFMGGETELSKRNKGDGWGPCDRFLARYDGKTKLRWISPVDTVNGLAISVAGDLLFSIDCRSAQLQVYDAVSGLKLGTATPGAPVGYSSGWVDFPMCVRAMALKNGETLVFVEEDWCAKIIVYRFTKNVEKLFEGKLSLEPDGLVKQQPR